MKNMSRIEESFKFTPSKAVLLLMSKITEFLFPHYIITHGDTEHSLNKTINEIMNEITLARNNIYFFRQFLVTLIYKKLDNMKQILDKQIFALTQVRLSNISEIIQNEVYTKFLHRQSWRIYLLRNITTDILLRDLNQNVYRQISTPLRNCS